jgi:hypothetical protein
MCFLLWVLSVDSALADMWFTEPHCEQHQGSALEAEGGLDLVYEWKIDHK